MSQKIQALLYACKMVTVMKKQSDITYTYVISDCFYLVAKFCPTLWPHEPQGPSRSLPGSSVHGISQTEILEWVAISVSRNLPDRRIEPTSPALAGRFFTAKPPRSPTYKIKLTDQQILENGTHNCSLDGEFDQCICLYVAESTSWNEKMVMAILVLIKLSLWANHDPSRTTTALFHPANT